MWRRMGWVGIVAKITDAIVAFRSAKGRSFAERKTTLFYAPVLGCVLTVLMVRSLAAQETPAANDPTGNAARDVTGSDEDAREAAVVARFVAVLEKNPRRGTALDKVYAFQVEHGSLDKFIQSFRVKATATTEPGAAAMIVGLLESLRGEEAAAAKAFENAERLAPENSLASFYLGQTLVLLGQPDKSIEAFERAIARQPARADLLEMFQALGRVHQRTARNEKALDVWNRLEQQFPNDERVQEQIATTLLEEEAFDAALPRFEKLAQSVKDRGRQLAFRMAAADIRVRLGQTEAALNEFETLLGQLNPDHWIYREVRRRIEAIYLRTEDRAGLATYYETWLGKHPDDLDAIVRVAKTYTALGRDEAASEWLERGVKLAPSRKELRRALIDRLLEARQVPEALAHFEQLDRDEPNNSDTLRDWGRAILKDSARDGTARRQAAATVWRKLSEARPKDALVASQVGDLLRQAEMIDEAVEQYRRAITLAPEATQYREYLGEFFHSLKRSDDALATWRPIAEGDQHTAANVSRLAEVLAGFGYVEEAITNYADACRLDPKDFGRHLKHIDLLSRAERHDEALVQLGLVEKLIANDEEREAWLSRDLRSLQAAGKLKERIAAAVVGWALLPVRSSPLSPAEEKDKAKDKERTGKSAHPTADKWYWLARAYEVDSQRQLAAQAVTKANQLAPRSIPILRASARLHEARRDFTAAVEVYARLVTLDRRYRTEYLQQLATLERQLGHRDKSLQAGRDLIAAAPGNPELAEFFAQLCFQLNAVDEGLNALRRSVRANSTDPLALVRLASALVERQRAAEAIDLLWRAFEKSQKLDDRLLVVQKLIEASAAAGNQQPRVIERLQRMQRERSQRREMTLCLAQAYQALGNDTQAQTELETLLSEETRDPVLLAQLRQLAEKRQDWTAAANYQREVWQLTNDKRDRFHLAGLMMKLDQIDEAVELLVGGESSKELTADVLKLLDGLYEAGKSDVLLARLKPLRVRFPDNWELLYREGVALAGKNPEEAAKRFEAVLAMNLRPDEPALTGSSKTGVPAASATGTQMPLVDRMAKIPTIMMMTSLVRTTVRTGAVPSRPTPATSAPARSGTSGSTARVFTATQYQTQSRFYYVAPRDYGEGRLAAWGWLTSFAKKDRKDRDPEAMKARLEQLASNATPQSLADQYAIHRFLSDHTQAEKTARKLAQHAEASLEEKALYLQELAQRHQPRQRVMANGQRVLDQAAAAPLYAEELDEALAIYRELAQTTNSTGVLSAYLNTIVMELALAGKRDEANTLLDEEIAKATTATQLSGVLMVGYRIQAMGVNRIDGKTKLVMTTSTLIRLLDRLIEFQNTAAANPAAVMSVMATTSTTVGGRIQTRAMPNYAGNVVQLHLTENAGLSSEQALELWSRFVKLSSFPLAVRLKQPEGRSASATQMVAVPMTATEISPLSLGAVFDQTGPTILTAVWNRFYSGGKVPDGFFADFESHARSPDASMAERILWLSSLGHLRWINNEQDLALQAWNEAAALAPDVIELQLNLARLYERAGKTRRALEIAEAVQPTTNEWLVERDQLILRRALAAENLPLAKVVAERLSVLKLSPHEVVPLAEQLVKFEMLDQAEVLLSQQTPAPSAPTNVRSTVTSSRNTVTTYRSAVDVRAQRVLLDIQLARGRHDEASVTALALLKVLETTDARNLVAQQGQVVTSTNGQTYIMTTVNGQQSLQPVNSRTVQSQISVPEYREHIFRALHKTGKLAAMIDEAEAKLKESPRNETLVAILMSYHKVTGNTERIGELTVRQLEIDQDRPEKRYTSIINLLNLDRVDEAAALTKLMLESSPDYFAPRCRDLIVRFKSKQELRKLAKVFESFDWSRYDQHPGVRPTIIELLTAEVETEDIGTKLFVAAWASRPELRYELLARTPDGDWWKRPEFAEGLRRLPIPSKEEDITNQWSAFGRAVKRPLAKPNDPRTSSEGAAFVTVLNRLLTIEADRDQLKTLASDVEKARQQFPSWKAGEVLLALIDLRRERVTAGRDVLVALLPTLRPVMKTSPLIPWEIANELARHDLSFDAAISYYEAALHDRGIEAWTSSSSPVRGIIQTLAERGRKTDARRMLLALLPANVQRGGNLSQLPSAIELNVAQWIGRELRGIGYAIDAIHIYQGALERTEGKSYGNGGHDPRTDLQSSLLIAFKELQPAALLDYFAAVGDAAPQLDLQLFVTELTTPSVRLRSRWTPLLEAIATNAEDAAALQSLLAKVGERHPDDLTTRILATQLALLTKDEPGAKSLVNQLVRYIDEHPLEPLSKSTITATMQRRASQPRLALWLIARAAWTVPELKADAEKLATAALAAASQQSDTKFAEAITAEQAELTQIND